MNNKKKKIIIACLLGLVVCLGIGFAAFSTTLKINGSAKVSPDGENYKVFFVSSVDSLTRYDRGDFDGESNSDKVDPGQGHFEDDTIFTNTGVTFSEDGQSVDYKFYILNAGKYDAHITNLDIGNKTCTPGEDADPALAASACSSINLSVILGDEGNQTTYTSSQAISDHILPKGTWEQIIVRITYPEGSPLADGDLEVTWKDISFLTATSASYAPPVPKSYEVGEEFCLDTECFYTIKDNGDTLYALAKYNLYAGYVVDWSEESIIETISNEDPKYGLQNSIAKAWEEENDIQYGAIEFYNPESDTSYWSNGENLLPKYGTEYMTDVFDSNSTIYPYINEYQNTLHNMGYTSISTRLLNKEDLENFGCIFDYKFIEEEKEPLQCTNIPDFFFETSFWSGVGSSSEDVIAFWKDDDDYMGFRYKEEKQTGIRPVIEISKLDIH